MRAVGSLPRAAMRLLQLSLLSLGTGEAKAAAALQVATCFVSRVSVSCGVSCGRSTVARLGKKLR